MKQRQLGPRTVSAIGLGGMPMSIEGRPDRDRSVATIHAALDAGVTLIDTADSYHRDAGEVGHNEKLIAQALRERFPHNPPPSSWIIVSGLSLPEWLIEIEAEAVGPPK